MQAAHGDGHQMGVQHEPAAFLKQCPWPQQLEPLAASFCRPYLPINILDRESNIGDKEFPITTAIAAKIFDRRYCSPFLPQEVFVYRIPFGHTLRRHAVTKVRS